MSRPHRGHGVPATRPSCPRRDICPGRYQAAGDRRIHTCHTTPTSVMRERVSRNTMTSEAITNGNLATTSARAAPRMPYTGTSTAQATSEVAAVNIRRGNWRWMTRIAR